MPEIRVSDHYRPFAKQAEFHADAGKYRLFGGAAGPGKSFALLWEAILHCLQYPGSNSLLLRRTFPRLQQGLIDHFVKYVPPAIYGGAKNYNSTDHVVRFPNRSSLRFGHCQHETDVRNYQGAEYLFIGFDELTEFPYAIWDFLKSRNRCPIEGTYPCMAGATNPGGVGHSWVKALWLDKTEKALRMVGVDPLFYRADDYTFTKATVLDNPIYAADQNYMASLQSLAPQLRAAMLDGSWDVFAGQYFDNFDKAEAVISIDQRLKLVKPWWPRWMSQDWGFQHHSVVLWHTKGDVSADEARKILGREWKTGREVVITYREYVKNQTAERVLASEVSAMCDPDDKRQIRRFFLSPDAFAKRTSANTIDREIGDVLSAAGLPRPSRADDDRIGGWRLLYGLLNRGEWLMDENCTALISGIPLLIRDEKKLEDVQKTDDVWDDVGDCARYGLKSMLSPREEPFESQLNAKLTTIEDMHAKHMTHLAMVAKQKGKTKSFRLRRMN